MSKLVILAAFLGMSLPIVAAAADQPADVVKIRHAIVDALGTDGVMTIRRVKVAGHGDGPAKVAIPADAKDGDIIGGTDIYFAGYDLHFISDPLVVPKEQAAAIRSAMSAYFRTDDDKTSDCVPQPGYLIMIERPGSDGKSTRVATAAYCFACNLMEVAAGGPKIEANINEDVSAAVLAAGASLVAR